MTLRMVKPPVYWVTCDRRGCAVFVGGDSQYAVRTKAAREGWQLRPARGKGSRTAPDHCPEHRTVAAS